MAGMDFGGGGGGGNITSYDQVPAGGLRGSAAGGGPNSYLGTGGKYGSFTPPTNLPGNIK